MESVDACREYLSAKCKCTACYYCEGQFGWHEHDHFPLPRRAGGDKTVPACVDCHALKDRITLQNWPLDATFGAMTELCQLVPEGVLVTLDTERLPEAHWELPAWSHTDVMTQWQSLAPMTRVLFGKIMATKENAPTAGDVVPRCSANRRGHSSISGSTSPVSNIGSPDR